MNKRIYVTKKPGFQVESAALHRELCQNLGLALPAMSRYVIYDVFDADEQDLQVLKQEVLAEVNTDEVYEAITLTTSYLAYEPLSGQYDQRSDSATQCLRLIRPNSTCTLTSGTLLVFERTLSAKEYDLVAHYLINPLESQRKDLSVQTRDHQVHIEPVATLVGFRTQTLEDLVAFQKQESLAMHLDDLVHIQAYFEKEGRDPLYSEIKVLDTYWSDHCRHTTFETRLSEITVREGNLKGRIDAALAHYVSMRKDVQRDMRKMSLMDMASIVARHQKANGTLTHVEESEEVNACSVEFDIEVDGQQETWLVMYKNETHNHPTEIEPFGGASTCIGGAIRDPLSGRAYVYQAMRISGAADITQPIDETLPNKLPQRLISKGAAAGYSSYGNQIGLATTFVKELYDPGYMAKRMEVGAVVGAVKKDHVLRARCAPKDWIVLLGGPTGRDGIGGATGSSMQHDASSLQTCGAQVQKGNAIIERKLQRLFRNPDVTKRIKKANDFGAGGVSVAIGELAEGIVVDLDAIDVKYNGLNGMEIAISESQERMAIVIDPIHFDAIAAHCEAENLVARKVGEVSDTHRLQMFYQGQCVVDLCRDFIETHGVEQQQQVEIETNIAHHPFVENVEGETLEEKAKNVLRSLNVASQQGMVELFDASIGRSTVLNPFGGVHRLSEAMASVQKLPVAGNSDACSILTYGFIPHIAKANPFLGASYGVVEAMARLISVGGSLSKATISCQEYFESLKQDPLKWGKVSAAMLGLIEAQQGFGIAAIGGKDSMSGTYEHLSVPPTLITFALNVAKTADIKVNHFTKANQYVYVLKHTPHMDFSPNYELLKDNFRFVHKHMQEGTIHAAAIVGMGGLFATLAKMSFGNHIGAKLSVQGNLFAHTVGDLVLESAHELHHPNLQLLGHTSEQPTLTLNKHDFAIADLVRWNQERFENVYPLHSGQSEQGIEWNVESAKKWDKAAKQIQQPKVIIPVFPGTNCEYDSAKAFEKAGGVVEIFPINNQTPALIETSIATLAAKVKEAQILMLAGGFSGGDEPDGSGKFIVSVLKNPLMKAAIDHMRANDGLILGICNGFQALIKSGLLPYGQLQGLKSNDPTLFRNDINRHVAKLAYTKVYQNHCVFTKGMATSSTHLIPFSHGEGKFVATTEQVQALYENNQIVTLYCDPFGNSSGHGLVNINGSIGAIEGICSPDGRIFGKMGHSERYEPGLFKNVEGNLHQDIFRNAITFFTWEDETNA